MSCEIQKTSLLPDTPRLTIVGLTPDHFLYFLCVVEIWDLFRILRTPGTAGWNMRDSHQIIAAIGTLNGIRTIGYQLSMLKLSAHITIQVLSLI